MEQKINIKEALDWYIQAGVDVTCGNFCCLKNEEKPIIESKSPIQVRTAVSSLSQASTEARKNARDLCLKANTIEELQSILGNFEGCALKFTAKSTVFGNGDFESKIMIIGEAPGADEDRLGAPFVGKSGGLLDKMLAGIGLTRKDVYITNVLPWRPPGNRSPTDSEIAVCLPFLKRQIDLLKPKIILLLGGSAANSVLDNNESISKIRGHWHEYVLTDKSVVPAIATFHPAYLLRNAAQKSKAWSDLLRVKQKLCEN